MNISRSLVFGILLLTIMTVVLITSVLMRNTGQIVTAMKVSLDELSKSQEMQLDKMLVSQQSELNRIAEDQKKQNTLIAGTIDSLSNNLSTKLGEKISKMGEEEARLTGMEIGGQMQILIDAFVVSSQTLSESLAAYKQSCDMKGVTPDRAVLDMIMSNVLTASPKAIAIWNVWGENAFDDKDQEHIDEFHNYFKEKESYLKDFWTRRNAATGNTEEIEIKVPRGQDALAMGKEAMDARPTTGETGRYSPWIHRVKTDQGEVLVRDYCQTFLEETYFLVPYRDGSDYIDPPYMDEGSPVTGLCSPIRMTETLPDGTVRQKTLGVVGIDINVNAFAEMLKTFNPLEGGYAVFVTPGGIIAGHKNSDFLTKSITGKAINDDPDSAVEPAPGGNDHTLQVLKEGKEAFYYDETFPIDGEETLKIHVPIKIGSVPVPWTVLVVVKKSKVVAASIEAKNEATNMNNVLSQSFEKSQEVMVKSNSDVAEALKTDGSNIKTLSAENIEKLIDGTNKAQTQSFRFALLTGFGVLAIAGFLGILFAGAVNRSINAKDHWYRQVLDTSPTPICVVDMDKNLTLLNQAACKLLRIDSEQSTLGQGWETVWQHAIGKERASLLGLERDRLKVARENFNGVDWEISCDHITDIQHKRIGMSEILQDVSARENILHIASEIEGVVQQTVTGVGEIASDAHFLSQGAQQQSEQLQVMMDGMLEMSRQTKKNVQNAEEANVFTREAATAASSGQAQMKRMVTSMQEISSTSTNTQSVIKTIESIAFQTNLLALNAAVEAARAGTHGKGFAVVAEEVRNLASRSAKAAQETASLLESSNQQIRAGADIANQTSDSLNRIAELVSQSTDKVSSIADSSKQQDLSMTTITQGLAQIDSVAKNNLEAIQRTASATEELNEMTLRLSDSMKRISR